MTTCRRRVYVVLVTSLTLHDDVLDDCSPTCEAVTLVSDDGTDPCQETVVEGDQYVRCGSIATGRYRLSPETGGVVANWLCRRHRDQLSDAITKTLDSC